MKNPFNDAMTSQEIIIALNWQIDWYLSEIDRNNTNMETVRELNKNIAYLLNKQKLCAYSQHQEK